MFYRVKSPLFTVAYCGTNLCRNADSGAVNTVAAMMRGEVRKWIKMVQKGGTGCFSGMEWHLQQKIIKTTL